MNMILFERINSIIAWLLLVFMLLLSLPAFTRYLVRKNKLSNTHWLWKLNRKLHKLHVPLSVVCSAFMIIHIILSYLALKHFPLLGYLIFVFFLILALSGHLKKKFSSKWFNIHRRTTVLILVAVILHIIYELP